MKESSFTDGHVMYVKDKALIAETGQQTVVQRSHWEVLQTIETCSSCLDSYSLHCSPLKADDQGGLQ